MAEPDTNTGGGRAHRRMASTKWRVLSTRLRRISSLRAALHRPAGNGGTGEIHHGVQTFQQGWGDVRAWQRHHLVAAGGEEVAQGGPDEAMGAADAHSQGRPRKGSVPRQVCSEQCVAVGEKRLQLSARQPPARQPAQSTERKPVADFILEKRTLRALGHHAVRLLPESEGAGLLLVTEGDAVFQGGMHRHPLQGKRAQAHPQHGSGADGKASRVLEDVDRVEGRVEALEGAGAGVPVEDGTRTGGHGAPREVQLRPRHTEYNLPEKSQRRKGRRLSSARAACLLAPLEGGFTLC